MPKRIPIAAAKRLAQAHGCRQVIILAWDGKETHVVTYGETKGDCIQAAEGGNKVKRALGWPEDLCKAEPYRARRGRIRKFTDADIRGWIERSNCVDGSASIAEARAAIDDARSLHLTPPAEDAPWTTST